MPYFLWSVFAIIYYRIDAVMLSLMTTESVVGWYGAAYRFFDVLMFLPSIVSWAMFPVLSRLKQESGGELIRVTRKSLDFILLAGIPVSIAVFVFSKEIIALFFGLQEYTHSVALLQIFSVGIILVYVDFILGTTLFASDKQRQWTAVAFGALLLNPVLNYVLIPYAQVHTNNGGVGAAIATLITELFVMMMALAILPREILSGARVHVQLKGIVAGVCMGLTLWLARASDLPWILDGIVASGIYVGVLLLLRTFTAGERSFLQGFFSFQNLKKTFVPTRG
jgi:O-antigen/teichoic acid export membrane protein